MGLTRFSPDVARKVGHYVYLYIDPETEDVFYVGKGRGNRAFTHLEDDSEHEKVKRIRHLRSTGPRAAHRASGPWFGEREDCLPSRSCSDRSVGQGQADEPRSRLEDWFVGENDG